jgi:hypothetical protein
MNNLKPYEQLTDVVSVKEILNKIAIFGGLNDSQFDIVFSVLKKAIYKKDELIFRQG